jgi:predicted metal-dependent hydrolase
VQVESALLFETPAELFARVFKSFKPRSPVPEVRVEFRRFANANSTIRLEAGRLLVRISDLLEGAPAPVLEALAHILIAKLFRREVPPIYNYRYRLYLHRREVRRSIHLIRQIRGRKVIGGPKGTHFDLEEIFDELNRRHFDGLLARPALGWSPRPSRSILGHFDPSHNAIIVSRSLDRPDMPRLAVEYIVFHEMLHLRYPVEHRGAARRVHPAAFRAAERAFPGFKEARQHLNRLR